MGSDTAAMAMEVTSTAAMTRGSDATVAIPTVVMPTAAVPTGAINMAAMTRQ